MSPFFVALTITDVLLLVLLVTLPVRVHWAAKIAAIVVVFGLNFFTWGSSNSGRGWPLTADLPSGAVFVSCYIVESVGGDQAIYVWVIPRGTAHGVFSYRPGGNEPRAYRLPYSRSLHEACVNADTATRHGRGVTLGRGGNARKEMRGVYHAYLLPAPSLPKKTGGG